ncbi:uncharacterized protein K489DRAFT_403378 [Dissoconium aciculare CBS 342.82]|uniref:Uncharacterized protein n=1 Tax=Dissoconium aciculare CBS 342.82 TaxID=1314786 RepID=A0A6J3LYH4_9PEZI|nr:uncharacterized protein K489DRAFT_403378 [Dissoconium aciculare CBS 342.82]KAF1820811.1 hypothetical protein K489DRAFT_403378 [Dissoconium aciculare CBS 342.82]
MPKLAALMGDEDESLRTMPDTVCCCTKGFDIAFAGYMHLEVSLSCAVCGGVKQQALCVSSSSRNLSTHPAGWHRRLTCLAAAGGLTTTNNCGGPRGGKQDERSIEGHHHHHHHQCSSSRIEPGMEKECARKKHVRHPSVSTRIAYSHHKSTTVDVISTLAKVCRMVQYWREAQTRP